MKRAALLLILLAVGLVNNIRAQSTCTALGQNPGSAFPVCGTMKFSQISVPECGGRKVPGPCNEVVLTDVSPFWYKFTCYEAGTLGFEITPNNITDDYDWQLFDVTGRNVQDVFTDEDLFVACNWSGYGGKTGASDQGGDVVSCSGNNPIWSAMPSLKVGHEYLLLVSHFSPGQSGYSLEFKGGTAKIADENAAIIRSSVGLCSGNSMYVKLDKPVKCSSIADNGSDFEIGGTAAKVVSASSAVCSGSFTTDSIIVHFDQVLSPGNYSVHLKRGSDDNTLLNACDVEMADATVNFPIYENVFADFTYDLKTGCTVDTIKFAHDGAHNVNRWTWTFDEGISAEQSPTILFRSSGNKTARLIVANDHCTDTSSVGIDLPAKIDAAFMGPEITCAKDAVTFTNQSTGQITSYTWNFGNNVTSSSQNPDPFYYSSGPTDMKYRVSLTVSDEAGCRDSAVSEIDVVGNCNIVVPSAFSPNRDGRNDELYPSNAFNADNLVFRVYNRFGRIVFQSHDWQKKWDGNVNGQPQMAGTYVWTLSYKLKATGKSYFFKGTTMLVR